MKDTVLKILYMLPQLCYLLFPTAFYISNNRNNSFLFKLEKSEQFNLCVKATEKLALVGHWQLLKLEVFQ